MLCYDTGMEKSQIKDTIQRGMKSLGYTSLLPVQEQTIPYIFANEDLLIQAETGSGKTAAYLIPVLSETDPLSNDTQVLIIAPTRELAVQIHKEASALSAYASIHCVCLIGGLDVEKQANALKHRPHVITGTPGRINDLLRQNKIDLSHLTWLIMDEADQISSTGQAEEMGHILKYTSEAHRICVSATVDETVSSFLPGNCRKLIFQEELKVNERIDAYYLLTEDKERSLLKLLEHEPMESVLIFVNYRSTVRDLTRKLRQINILSAPFSADYDEKTRLKTIEDFRSGKIRVICATDAMARGIDIAGISHVIHYDLPLDQNTYIHRSGRTAHQQNTGITISLISKEESDQPAAKEIMSYASVFQPDLSVTNDLTRPLKKEKKELDDTVMILIRAGRNEKLRPKDIAGALTSRLPFEQIGTIEIQDRYSLVRILNHDPSVLNQLQDLKIKGKIRKIEIAKAQY